MKLIKQRKKNTKYEKWNRCNKVSKVMKNMYRLNHTKSSCRTKEGQRVKVEFKMESRKCHKGQ